MSREIDERIVAMYFDDKNFSSGAQQAIKTLDELKKSCNMEGVGKGLEIFSDVTKKMNLDDLRKKTNNVKSAFESLGGVMKKVFGAALSPIQSVKHEIDNLNGYIGKVFGIDLASKIVGSLENVFRSLTVAPISAGWGQYENTMDSIKTIMSSTGEDIDTVKAKLGEMTEYANQTIYSLNDMTSNLGKFTNNGVKLNDATNAMIGLANATADAGQGAQQASMAMYNVSQAIGVGKMTTIDWKSLENANIATKKLKQTFIDAAVAHGTLTKKIEKDKQTGEDVVKYFTKAEKGSKSVEVSVENFRETLNKGWLDKTAMMNTFAIFSGQLTADEIAALGFSKEESARLYQIGQEAMAAATEVRTFSKMMDALRESVQSGWAASFEYIFGDMEEGTNLWTMINDKIDGILSKSTENRNNILMSWRGLMKDEDGQIRKIRDVYENRKQALFLDYDAGRISAERYAEELTKLEESLGDKRLWVDYREIAIETFNNIFDVFTNIGGAVKGAWADVFGEFNADTLKNITLRIREAVDAVKTWLGSSDDADSRISKIRKGLSGVFTILKVGLNAAKAALETVWSIVKPLLDPLLTLFAKFGDWIQLKDVKNFGDMIGKLSEKFKGLWDKLTKLGWKGALIKIGDWFSGVWSNIKTGVGNWLRDNGLGGVVEWFGNVKESLVTAWNNLFGEEGTVTKWWNDENNPVSNFFKNVWETVSGLFATTDADGNAITMPIVEWFNSMWKALEDTWNSLFGKEGSVTKWWDAADNPVKKFFNDIWTTVSGLFATTDADGNAITMPIVQWFTDLWGSLEETWKSLFGENGSITKWWYAEDNPVSKFFNDVWTTVSGLFATTDADGNAITMPIVQWFTDLWSTLEETWNSLFGKEGSITKWWDANDNPIKKFFNDVWTTVSSLFATTDADGNAITMPIVQWFTDLWSTLEETWNNLFGEKGSITGWWNKTDNPIKKFFNDVWDAVSGTFESKKGEDAPIVKFFKSIVSALDSAWKSIVGWFESDTAKNIGKFFSDAWGWLMEKLNISSPDEADANTIAGKLRKNGMNLVASTSGAPYGKKAAEQIAGSDSPLSDEEIKRVPVLDFLIRIKEALVSAWDSVTNWEGWQSIGQFFTDMWAFLTELFNKITDKGDVDAEAAGKATEEQKSFLDKVGEFVNGVIDEIIKLVKEVGASELAKSVVDTVSNIFGTILNIIEVISGWFKRTTDQISGKGEKSTGDFLASTDFIVPAIAGILGVIMQIVSYKKAGNLAEIASAGGIMTNIGGQILKVCAGIMLVAVAIRYLGSMNTEELIKGGVAITLIGVLVGSLLVGLSQLTSNLVNLKDDPVKSWERVIGKLITTAGMVGMLWMALEKLPEIIDKMSEAKKYSGLTGDDVMKPLMGIVTTVAGIALTMTLVQKLLPKGLDIGASVKTTIAVFSSIVAAATVLMGTGGLFQLFEELEKKVTGTTGMEANMKKFLDKASILTGGIHQVVTSMLFGNQNTAAQLNKQADDIKSLGEVANKFDLATITSVTRLSEMVVMLGAAGSDINITELGTFKQGIALLGETLNEFASIVLGDNSEMYQGIALLVARGPEAHDKVNSAIDMIRNLMSVFEPLSGYATAGARYMFSHVVGDFTDFGTNAESVAKFISALNGIIDGLAGKNGEGLHDVSGINFDGIAIIQKIYDAMQMEFDDPTAKLPEFNAQPLVDSIITAIGLKDEEIARAVHGLVQNGLNLLNTGGEDYSYDLSGVLGPDSPLYGFLTGNSFDLSNLTGITDTMTEQINKAVDNLNLDEASAKAKKAMRGFSLNVTGLDLSSFSLDADGDGVPDIMKNLEEEWGKLSSQMEGMNEFSFTVKPILDTTDFDEQYASFSELFSGNMPVSMGAVIDIGDQPIPINDTNIINELRMLRYDLQNVSANLQSVMYNVDGNLANHIDGVTNAVRNIKMPVTKPNVRDIDNALYRSAVNSSLTGVSTYTEVIPMES